MQRDWGSFVPAPFDSHRHFVPPPSERAAARRRIQKLASVAKLVKYDMAMQKIAEGGKAPRNTKPTEDIRNPDPKDPASRLQRLINWLLYRGPDIPPIPPEEQPKPPRIGNIYRAVEEAN